jgi:uncharacterized surface protein with fasciclin (FAS1) repeats
MKTFTTSVALAALIGLAACTETTETDAATETASMTEAVTATTAAPTGTIVELAQSNADLSSLVSAVQAADLGGTLSGDGPFTVFAPTNAAFEAVPQTARDQLMSPAGKEDLTGILTYHVVAGETMSPALITAIEGAGAQGYTLKTVNGATLKATLEDGSVILTDAAGNNARVTQTDVDATNGVVHLIDKVLMPQ